MAGDASTRDRGRGVEAVVARHLEAAGLEIVEQNFEAAGAEVDIIAIDRHSGEDIYVFVEVRSRASAERGLPLETIGRSKQRRVIRAATAWLVGKELWERVAVRFDAVGVVGRSEPDVDPNLEIVWVPNAFEA